MLKLSNQTIKVILGTLIIVGISFLVAYFYYDGKNRAEDPRIVDSKIMFKQFDELLNKKNYYLALPLLDSIELILLKAPGYAASYERGIVFNNRGSVFISLALYESADSIERQRFLEIAKHNIDSSITIYQWWLNKYIMLTREELSENIKPFFNEDDPEFKGKIFNKILNKRVDDLIMAQNETPRRLSVCYTNLGIVLRHQFKQNEAAECYIKAIKLWKENYTARNNFNVLMGNPPEDRSIIDQLFPPEKNKFK